MGKGILQFVKKGTTGPRCRKTPAFDGQHIFQIRLPERPDVPEA
jgi:hypothetical protein